MRFRHESLAMLTALALVVGGGVGCGADDPATNQTDNQDLNDNDDNQDNDNQDNNQNNDNQNNEDDNSDWEPEDPPETSNEVFVSEFMTLPTEMSTEEGQWVEFYNSTDEVYDLYSCEIWTTGGDDPVEIDESLEIGAGEFGTVATGQEPGFEADVVLEELALAQGAGVLELTCNDEIITFIDYDASGPYPVREGVSAARDAEMFEPDEGPYLPWLWCEGTGEYNGADVGSPGEMPEACPGIAADSADDIATVRQDVADAYDDEGDEEAVNYDDMTLERVMVTYTRPEIGDDDPAGFYVQAAQEGPALFVAVDDVEDDDELPVRAGQIVDLEIETADLVAAGTFVTEFGDLDVVRLFFPPSMMTVDVTDADDLADDTEAYESRLVSADFTIDSEPGYAGDNYDSYEISTEGTGEETGDELVFRVPAYHVDNLGLEEGCELRIEDVPVTAYFGATQLSIWALYEAELLDCTPTEPVGTRVLDDSRVYVDFNRALGETQNDGSDFTIEGLDVESASYTFNEVLLHTSEQTGGEEYTIEVDDSLTDFWGEQAGGSVDFVGFEPLEVAITELMARYQDGSEYAGDVGEFVELHNPGDQPYDLDGCVLDRPDVGDQLDIEDVTIPAGEEVVFGAPGGSDADYEVAQTLPFAVLNSGTTFELRCDDEVLDQVSYGGFHVELGVSLQKDAEFITTPNGGDDGFVDGLWCLTPQVDDYEFTVGSEDGYPKYGTPGAENTSCDG